MVIILSAKDSLDNVSIDLYRNTNVVLQMDEDGKGFTVYKHRFLSIKKENHYHISYLTNIIKAGM